MIFRVSYDNVDQGIAGNGNSVKDLVDSIGTTKRATLLFSHSRTCITKETYTFLTTESIPDNIKVVIEEGAVLSDAGGSADLTINGSFDHGSSKCFDWTGTGSVSFGAGAVKEVYPEWWGENTTPGTTEMTTAIQSAIDSLPILNGGGLVKFLAQLYYSDSLTLKYNVNMEGIAPQNFSTTAPPLTSSIKLKAGATAPLITTDNVNGGTPGNSAIGVGAKRYQNSTIKNIYFDGNLANQTSFDADIIRSFQSWNVTIQGCLFRAVKGFAIRILDGNLHNILDNFLVSTSLYIETLADSLIRGNQIGGGNTDIWTPFWLNDPGEHSWQNIITENLIWNNSANVASTSYTFTANATTEIITTSGTHGWSDGTPVAVLTTNTLPAGLVTQKTYYVGTEGSTTLKLYATRATLNAGTPIDITDAGTGTHTIQMGKSANVWLSGGSGGMKWNTFTANRIDQAYGHGILLSNADENTFVANVINGSGMGNAVGQAGIKLENTSNENIFTGNTINGTDYVSSIYTSKQDYGIQDDGTCTGNKISGNIIINHDVADISVAEYTTEDITDEIFIPHKEFDAVAGSPIIGAIGGTRRTALLFDAAGTEIAAAWIMVPKGWSSADATVVWVNAGAGAGDVVWIVQGLPVTVGETTNAIDSAGGGATADTAGAQDVIVETDTAGSLSSLVEGDWLSVRVTRLGGDGSDTLANDAGVIGVKLVRD